MIVTPEGRIPSTLHLHMRCVWHVRMIVFWFSLVYQKSCHPGLSIALIHYAVFDIPKSVMQFLGIILWKQALCNKIRTTLLQSFLTRVG